MRFNDIVIADKQYVLKHKKIKVNVVMYRHSNCKWR